MKKEGDKKIGKGKIWKADTGTEKRWRIYGKGFLKGGIKGGLLGLLFYKNPAMMLLCGIVFGIIFGFLEQRLERKRKQQEITLQFKEGLQGIAAALSAGYSIENAFFEAEKDLILLYGEEAVLVKEFYWIEKQIELNRPLEQVLYEFAERWETEDILHFAQVFQTAKRTGGNLILITHSTADKISQKIEVQREIASLIAGKKMEGMIMNLIPPGMILYFWFCSPGFLDCFYRGSGRVVSTGLMFLYVCAYAWSQKISDIKV